MGGEGCVNEALDSLQQVALSVFRAELEIAQGRSQRFLISAMSDILRHGGRGAAPSTLAGGCCAAVANHFGFAEHPRHAPSSCCMSVPMRASPLLRKC